MTQLNRVSPERGLSGGLATLATNPSIVYQYWTPLPVQIMSTLPCRLAACAPAGLSLRLSIAQ